METDWRHRKFRPPGEPLPQRRAPTIRSGVCVCESWWGISGVRAAEPPPLFLFVLVCSCFLLCFGRTCSTTYVSDHQGCLQAVFVLSPPHCLPTTCNCLFFTLYAFQQLVMVLSVLFGHEFVTVLEIVCFKLLCL